MAVSAKQARVQRLGNEAELGDAACPPGPQMDCKNISTTQKNAELEMNL